MSSVSFAARDSATMLRRSLLHTVRYPIALIVTIGIPAMLLLLFVGVFGGALGAGVTASTHGAKYVDYLLPGILLMSVGYGASTTTQSVNRDMTEGIISRFRTMAISRSSVLTGHVLGAVIRTLAGAVVLIAVALAVGFRSHADPLAWLAAAGLVTLLALGLSWLAVAVGLAAGTIEGTTGFALIMQMLPLVSSAFVPTSTMSSGVAWFAHNEPFTSVIDTLRGLVTGAPIGHSGILAVAWCAGFTLLGYLWAGTLFRRQGRR